MDNKEERGTEKDHGYGLVSVSGQLSQRPETDRAVAKLRDSFGGRGGGRRCCFQG